MDNKIIKNFKEFMKILFYKEEKYCEELPKPPTIYTITSIFPNESVLNDIIKKDKIKLN